MVKISAGELPGMSRLAKDYLDNTPVLSDFFAGDFRNPDVYLEKSRQMQSRNLPLTDLVPILREQNVRFGCGPETLSNIDSLLTHRAFAVLTGQQVALFSGPLYTIHKALTAIRLSSYLTAQGIGHCVPIFWLAADDHDLKEANHVNIISKNNELVKISYADASSDDRLPLFRIHFTSSIVDLVRQISDATHASDFKKDVIDALQRAYQPGTSFAGAFGTWFTQLFRSYGLILIDASDARVKRMGKSVFIREISERSPSSREARLSSGQLIERGYHAQVAVHEGLLNLFFMEKGRHSIQSDGDGFIVRDLNRRFSQDELLTIVDQRPEHFSPNVLLRPIYQDALLPTIAYIGGPAEIAYFAQMKGIFREFGIPMPIVYPRKSLTILETKIEKILLSLDVTVKDMWTRPDSIISRLLKSQISDVIDEKLGHLRISADEDLRAIRQEVGSFEPTMQDSVDVTKNKIQNQIDFLAKKIFQAYRKRNEIQVQHIQKAITNLYPNQHLQERELNMVPYLFKYGFQLIGRLYESMDMTDPDHQIIRM